MRTLIVVDVQNDFVKGSLGSEEAQAIIPNVKKKIENRNPYITYLENLDALPMSCFILLSVWLFERWHILLNPCIKM